MAKAVKRNTSKKNIPVRTNKGTARRTNLKEIESDTISEESLNICKSFREIRLSANLTQDKFAASLDVALSYIKAVEQGRFAPAHTIIVRCAKFYKRSIDWIYKII